MQIQRLKDQLKIHEGVVLKLYKCSQGYYTCGVGRNIQANGISMEEAELMLANDIDDCIVDLKRNIGFFNDLPETIQEVMVNLCFNIGINKLLNFKKTIGLLRDEKYLEAGDEILRSKWSKQVGQRSHDLADMIRSCAS